jgi:NAD(P)H-nitrite reductase large subunit
VTAAEALARSARHQVTLVTAETHGYYARPRLSHGIALDDAAAAGIVLKPFDALRGVRVLSGVEAWLIDRDRQRIAIGNSAHLDYDVLVLATGSAARIPPALLPLRAEFVTLNNLDDLLTLRRRRAKIRALGKAPRWAVVGGGLIGCELASDLRKAGDTVTIFHREDRLIERQLTEAQSQALDRHFAACGIEVRYRQDLDRLPYPFDGVIVAAGFAPRVDLAAEAGLSTGRGIVVNDYLRTEDPAVYAVGDVAEIGSRLHPFVSPIRSQALWLAEHLEGRASTPWKAPQYAPVLKIHGFRPEPKAALA